MPQMGQKKSSVTHASHSAAWILSIPGRVEIYNAFNEMSAMAAYKSVQALIPV